MTPPDSRGWVAIALFALSTYVLTLLAFFPALAQITLFSVLAQAIIVSGLIGGVVAFFYASSKSSADKDETIKKLTKDGQ